MKIFIILLLILFTSLTYSKNSNDTDQTFIINLKDWPADIAAKIKIIEPRIVNYGYDLSELNTLLKKLDQSFNFNRLKLMRMNASNELLLVGEISPQVKKINFIGLTDMNDTEALTLMGLNVGNILNENALKSGSEKLAQFYRDLGYRFAQVKYDVFSDSAIEKTLNFIVLKKEKTRLIDIQIEGLQALNIQKTIQKNLKKKFRLPTLNQETLNKISTELRKQLSFHGYYLTPVTSPQIIISADELSARLIFKLKSTPRYNIEIINSKRYEHTNLESDILKLDSYSSKDQNMSSELVERLKNFYLSQGYPHNNITTYEKEANNLTHLILNVDEGPYTEISDFKITGQYSRPEIFYKKKFFDLASTKVQNKMYVKDEIEQAVKNLLIYLQNDGFINAKLTRVFISTERENPGHGVLIIQLDEGAQVKIADIQYSGVSPKNEEQLRKIAKLEPHQSLSLSQLEITLTDINNFYQNAGYIEYKLLNENTDLVNYFDNNTKLNLKFEIQEGPRVEVQSILIDGNTKTKDKLILIELDFKVGDILTPIKIEESISRLQRTGHFNSVEITTLEKNTPIAQRTVVVNVIERDPGLTVLGVGFTDENKGTLHGYAGLAYRNFEGWGIGASFRSELNYNFASIKYLEQKHTFGFVFPYLFESRARFRTSATRSNTIADVRINKVSEANTAIFSLEQDFTSHVTGILSYTVSTYKDHGITNEDEIKFGYASESSVIGSIGPTLDIDYRDNLFNPTSGSFSRFSFEYAAESLGNNNVDDFYRLIGQTTHYFPFKDTDFVFVQSIRGGYVKNTDDRGEGVPFDKRGFSLGGRTTIRGFSSEEFFPKTTDIGANFKFNTSSNYELVKSEIRFPLSSKYDLAGAIFYDGGQVHIEGVELSDNWRDAAGFGIRYNTPVGPLNLEYAHKLNKKTEESDGAFHLSVGIF